MSLYLQAIFIAMTRLKHEFESYNLGVVANLEEDDPTGCSACDPGRDQSIDTQILSKPPYTATLQESGSLTEATWKSN
jgi:hypothetical protein